MSLNLDARMLKAIEDRAAENFPNITVENGTYPNFFETFIALHSSNEALPKRGDLAEIIESYTGELPSYQFISDDISRRLNEIRKFDANNNPVKITDIEFFSDHRSYLKDAISRFDSLPWEYIFSISLPKDSIRESMFNSDGIEFGQKCSIKKSDLLTEQTLPFETVPAHLEHRARGRQGIGALLLGPKGWSEENPYFRTEIFGYVPYTGLNNTVERVERNLESIMGLGLAMQIFSFNQTENKAPTRLDWIVHRKIGDAWIFDSRFNVEESLSGAIMNIASFKFPNTYPEEDRDKWIKYSSEKIGKVIESELNSSLVLSSKWYFDSFRKSDHALTYVRLMTCLEILLGDRSNSSSMSLSEVIGNRLAFLIGNDIKERSNILVKFKEIYNIRSRILHQGKHKLSTSDFSLMQTLKSYCERAIRAEVDMIIASR